MLVLLENARKFDTIAESFEADIFGLLFTLFL